MKLTPDQQAMLDGEKGWPLQIAMQMLTAVGAALDAPDMIPVTSTHLVIDGTALGEAGRDFLERLVEEGGRFAVPASINAIAVDRTKADMTAEEHDQIRMLEACEKMGALPSCWCLIELRPERQMIWRLPRLSLPRWLRNTGYPRSSGR